MKCVKLNSDGNFDYWSQSMLSELDCIHIDESFKAYNIFQNDHIKLGIIILEPRERIPFKVLKNNFKLVCLSGGSIISRSSLGGVSLLMFEKGEYASYSVTKSYMVNDLQNISEHLMVMALVEYKRAFSDTGNPKNRLKKKMQLAY
ncbi:hypothetical protein EZV76_11025 [Flagellimonas alvinocaridis]|uniref:Uncharacterized protein n=1 Tax=Flagellimonas alvinocaridis TaxID=2530200 RepID=A0A4S8RVP0_9FLAO|nr:hypothetical protein [Allomuricauda alvinocaridis]THV59349.1 hypothetical protein EZV76_11025 [Allomuricauda alvinocaridis]